MITHIRFISKVIRTLCVLLLIAGPVNASEITFTFENATYTAAAGADYFEFDVYASAAGGTLGPALVLVNYNPGAFGLNLSAAGGATVTPGALIAGNDLYAVIVNDNSSSRLAITIYYDVFSDGGGVPLTSTPQQLAHVAFRVDNLTAPAGLSFEEVLMQGQQYQDDLLTAYATTTADDQEEGTLDEDGDGVDDNVDECPSTSIPESVPTAGLRPNHFALLDGDTVFDTAAPGKRKGTNRSFTLGDTRGCSCGQIVEALSLGAGHRKHGCPIDVMETWSGGSAGKAGSLAEVPSEIALEGNYPNPFNPHTTIRYALPEAGRIRLVVYDVLGREVRLLVDGPVEAGVHELSFEADDLPSGLYVYRLESGETTMQRMMTLLR